MLWIYGNEINKQKNADTGLKQLIYLLAHLFVLLQTISFSIYLLDNPSIIYYLYGNDLQITQS